MSERERRIDRRTVLGYASGGLAALLAGCQSGSDGTATPDRATAGVGTPTPTVTATLSPTPDDGTTTAGGTATATPDPAAYRRRARELVALLADGSYEQVYDRFGPGLASQISPAKLEDVWTTLTEEEGRFRRVTDLEHGTKSGYHVVVGTATFERGQRRVVVSFSDGKVAGFVFRRTGADWTTPPYADRSSFTERDLSLSTPLDCSLAATLSMPKGSGEVPGVVLVHGSGPHGRDETIGPNKMFRDLAWGLASRGVAVLRYQKRTFACDVNLADVTIDEVVTDDALTAIDRLRGVGRVPAEDVVVAGHSIGATMAPRIAKRDGNLAGVVMLAALARPATTAMVDQTTYLFKLDGSLSDREKERLREVRKMVRKIENGSIADDEVVHLGGDEYWRTYRAYDPVKTATQLSIPRLVLQGGRDYQVTVEGDFAQWKEALGGASTVTFRTYPKLNHLFMPGSGKPTRREYFEPNHVSKQVVADVAAWTERVTTDG